MAQDDFYTLSDFTVQPNNSNLEVYQDEDDFIQGPPSNPDYDRVPTPVEPIDTGFVIEDEPEEFVEGGRYYFKYKTELSEYVENNIPQKYIKHAQEDYCFDIALNLFKENGWEFSNEFVIPFAEVGGYEAGLSNLINTILENNSTPYYTNELSANFDQHLRENGNPVDFFNYYFNNKEDNINYDLDQIDLSSLESQRWIIQEYLKRTTGFTAKKILDQIMFYEMSGTLESETLEAFLFLKELQKADYERSQRQLEELKRKEYLDYKNNIDHIVAYVRGGDEETFGVPLTKTEKERFLNFLLTVDPNTNLSAWGNVVNNDFKAVLKLAAYYFKGGTSDYRKIIRNEVYTEIEDKIKRNGNLKSRR